MNIMRSAVLSEEKTRDIMEEIPLRITANLTAYCIFYRFVITISFIVPLLLYHLSFRHYSTDYRFVITLLFIVLSLQYCVNSIVSSLRYRSYCIISLLRYCLQSIIPSLPLSIVWFRCREFVPYYTYY